MEILFLLCVFFHISFSQVYTESYTYKIKDGSGIQFWTTLPTNKVMKDDDVPSDTGSDVKVYIAKNEYEPFVVVLNPTSSGSVTVTLPDFSVTGITLELFKIDYVSITTATDSLGCDNCDYPDVVWPLSDGDSVSIVSGENTAFWVLVHVDTTVASGDYSADMMFGSTNIPISLHVFNFAISKTVHVKSQMNFGFSTVLDKYSVSGTGTDYWYYVDMMKEFWLQHRMTPKSVTWPGGLVSQGGGSEHYDCDKEKIIDEEGIWGYDIRAEQALKTGFTDGQVFPSSMFMTFQNNDASGDQRPDTLCGITRKSSDWMDNENSDYNKAFWTFYKAVEDHLRDLDLLDIVYHYGWNEPQDEADDNAVAWYSKQLKDAAPDIKLMVSEPPKERIYANENYPGGKIDIWLPVLNQYDAEESYSREHYCEEDTWVYFLHGTVPPYLNPITIDHPGIEAFYVGWLLWKYRIKGIAYYSTNNWGSNPYTDPATYGQNGNLFLMYPPAKNNAAIAYGSNNHRLVPSIRMELLRDGFEFYEYLYILNGNKYPTAENQGTFADKITQKIIKGVKNYIRDDGEFSYNIRRLIGLLNGKEISSLDLNQIKPSPPHTRGEGSPGNYYLNFQDPSGNPTDDPLVVDGNTYDKIGWVEYDDSLGYGFYGEMDHVAYSYSGSGTEIEKSHIYDNWGREKTFQYVVPNGCYDVTVSVGSTIRNDEHNYVVINSIPFVDDEANNNQVITRTKEICVTAFFISMEFMKFDEYTFMNYLKIEANGNSNDGDIFVPVEYVSPPTTDVYCTRKNNEVAAIVFGVLTGVFACSCGVLCLIVLIVLVIITSLLGFVNFNSLFHKIINKGDSSEKIEKEVKMKKQKKNTKKDEKKKKKNKKN